METKNKPVKKFRVGAIHAAIWVNTTKEGKAMPSVSIERSYKAGNEWKSTTSLRPSDLPAAALAINEAYKYLSMSDELAQDI